MSRCVANYQAPLTHPWSLNWGWDLCDHFNHSIIVAIKSIYDISTFPDTTPTRPWTTTSSGRTRCPATSRTCSRSTRRACSSTSRRRDDPATCATTTTWRAPSPNPPSPSPTRATRTGCSERAPADGADAYSSAAECWVCCVSHAGVRSWGGVLSEGSAVSSCVGRVGERGREGRKSCWGMFDCGAMNLQERGVTCVQY